MLGATMNDDERPPLPASAPSLDLEGRLVNRFKPVPPAADPEEAPLELAERTPTVREPRRTEFREPQPAPRVAARRVVVAAFALAVGALVVALVAGPRLSPHGLFAPRPALVIESQPPGATVRIGSEVVGTTPWAGDNLWQDATVTVELPGYRPWTARLQASGDQTLSATLRR